MSKTCVHCKQIIDDEDLFCPYCGTRQQKVCPNCGETISEEDVYCPNCGIKLYGDSAEAAVETTEATLNQENIFSSQDREAAIIASGDTVSDKIKLLVMAVISIIIVIGWYFYNVPHNEPITVTSSKIISDYQQSSAGGRETYTNKIVTVKGEIAGQLTDKDAGTIILFKDSTEKEMLIAVIPESHPEWKEKLVSGRTVQITGVCEGEEKVPQTKDEYAITIFIQSIK